MFGLSPTIAPFPSSSKTPQFGEENAGWTETDDIIETFLADYDQDSPHMDNEISTGLPGNTVDQVMRPSDSLIVDVPSSEAEQIPNPREMQASVALSNNPVTSQQIQKGKRWTEEEHKWFLIGLDKYGKGEWIKISRFYVVTKTPSQVASHAQKHFRREKCPTPLEKRRHSIHDIRMVNSKIVRSPSRVELRSVLGEPSKAMHTNANPYFYNASALTKF